MTIQNGISHSAGGWYTSVHPFLAYIMLDLRICLFFPDNAKPIPRTTEVIAKQQGKLVVLRQALRSAKAVLLTVWGCIYGTRFRRLDNLFFIRHNSSPVIEVISLLIDSLYNEAYSS